MARANFVKKARKSYPEFGIEKGDSYYWWSFAYGPTVKSKIAPRRSQLTRSEFLGQMYDLEDRISGLGESCDADSIESEVESIIDEIRQLGDECQEKLDNMPEQLQEAPSGEMLQNRVDECDAWALELEGVDLDAIVVDFGGVEDSEVEDYDDRHENVDDSDSLKEVKEKFAEQRTQENFENVIDELTSCTYNGE